LVDYEDMELWLGLMKEMNGFYRVIGDRWLYHKIEGFKQNNN